MANAAQLLHHLVLLRLQLLLVWQLLPFASATQTEMLALRLYTDVTVLMESYDLRLGIRMFLTLNLQINNIPRNTKWHENYHVVPTDNTLAFRCNVLYCYILKYR